MILSKVDDRTAPQATKPYQTCVDVCIWFLQMYSLYMFV